MTHHPIRDAWIVSYQGDNDAFALFVSNKDAALSTAYPMIRGKTRADAEERAERWRADVIEKHEGAVIARAEAAAKRVKAAKKKEAA